MGKYIRHLIGALVGALLGSVVAWLTGHGVVVDAGDVDATARILTDALTLLASLAGYAWTEKFLKRFRSVDAEGHADRVELKRKTHHTF